MKVLTPLIPNNGPESINLVPGQSPATLTNYVIYNNSNMFRIKKNQLMSIINLIFIEILELLTSSKPQKLVPGPYSMIWSYMSLTYEKNMKEEKKYLCMQYKKSL